ncbi:MAG: MaoC/PaaZ C-terminal domain-containing protein [Halioglobus sp.]
MTEVAYDDLKGLRACISNDFGPWGESLAVSQKLIDTFAELTTDKQWIHIDSERAESGPFGNTIAHGFLVLSLMPAVRPVTTYQLVGWGSAANYGIRALRFLQPVLSGSSIHARSRLLAVEQHRRGTLITQEVAIQGVGSDKPSLVFELQLLYMA